MSAPADIRHFIPAASICAAGTVVAEFRRTPFSDRREVLPFACGATIAEIVSAFDRPQEFATHGAVFLRGVGDRAPIEIARRHWHRVRPKRGTALFITCAPQGDDKGILQIAAAVALVALTAWVGGGGLAFGNPWHYLAAGSFGAQATAAAIGVAGAAALSTLSRPVVGASAAAAAETSSLGVAGITQNVLAVNQQVPWPMGAMRVSPPMLMRAYTTIEGTDQYVHGICGLMGPLEWDAPRVNETPVEDLPPGQFEYELRRGYDDDAALTLVNSVAFEETINLEMSKHRLDKDGTTLLKPESASYPQPHVHRTARNMNRFRYLLSFPQGLARFDSSTAVLVPFRVEVRELGQSTWRKLPELHLEASVRAPMRQEVWLHFGGDERVLLNSISGVTSSWRRAYARNAEWTADTYFNAAPQSVDTNSAHVFAGADSIHIFLGREEFPGDRYDVRIVRGFAQNSGAQHTDTTYTGGLFTFRTSAPPNQTIPNQTDFAGAVAIQSYTTFRDEYPFRNIRNLALFAFKAKNLQINSINAEVTPIIPVWDSVGEAWVTPDPDNDPDGLIALTSNPAALCRHVAIGPLNPRPRDPALLSGFEEWAEYCDAEGLSCNAVITEGSVERAATLAANCGDAVLRESDTFGPVIDRDRSQEGVKHAFSAHNMTSPLIMEKSFDRIADGILPTFVDAQRDYATRTLELPVYGDGVNVSGGPLLEAANYDGLVFESLVTRRARLDLRRKRRRSVKYSWETDQEQLIAVNGDIVALAHDLLLETYGMGRVKSFRAKAGNLLSVEVNGGMLDLPGKVSDDLWSIERIFIRTINDAFELDGPDLGAQIRLRDNQIVTVPVERVEGRTLHVEQGESGFPVPDGLARTSLIHVGARGQESRPVIIMNITPKGDYRAQIDAVDLAPDIFAGLQG